MVCLDSEAVPRRQRKYAHPSCYITQEGIPKLLSLPVEELREIRISDVDPEVISAILDRISTTHQTPALTFQLSWTDKRGGFHMEQSSDGPRLAKKLETIRSRAEIWTLDEKGQRIDLVGGCEENDGRCDDRRVRWNWWYEKDTLGLL